MSNSAQSPDNPPISGGNYEPTDVNIGGIMIFLGILLVIVIIAHLITIAMCRDFSHDLEEANGQVALREVIPSVAASRSYFPFPREQVSPRTDLQTFRQHEDEELNSYAWIDRKAGIVRIPIEQAMALVLQQGLPTRAGTNSNVAGPSSLQLQQLRPSQSVPSGEKNKP